MTCALLLVRCRAKQGSLARAAFLSARNDAIANIAIIAAGRHTHGTLLIKAGVPVKLVSERLGHGNPAFTIDTYQHVLPGMQAEAARTFEQLITEKPDKTTR